MVNMKTVYPPLPEPPYLTPPIPPTSQNTVWWGIIKIGLLVCILLGFFIKEFIHAIHVSLLFKPITVKDLE